MKANNPMKVRYNHSIQGCLYGAKVQANVTRKLQTQLHFGGHFFCEFIRHQRNTTARNAHHHGCAGRPVLLTQSPVDSFAGQLGVETAQADGKGPEGGQLVAVVHGQHVFRDLPKLQYNLLLIWRRRSGWLRWSQGSGSRLRRRSS
jgi:hypothetical protein